MSSTRNCARCGGLLAANARNGVCWPCFGKEMAAELPVAEGPTEAATPDNPPPFTFAENPIEESVGQTIGRYKLVGRLGEGGCGVVYVAEQTEPVRRRVALKLIKLGMDTKAVVARFEGERQAMAMMEHPNIARVFDAGTSATGRPYFIMELVQGVRITDYCDQHTLSTRERIELFVLVCQAIQHAHQKGVIHRDIKPSNILVTGHDGVAVPKVIDFGIAKAIESRLTEHTVHTQLHHFLGTPAYMSPEQAELTGRDIDTRSDIYSLGVLLYELLAGCTPFDGRELLAAGLEAMRRVIREQEPVRPSTKLSQTLVAAEVRRLKSNSPGTPGSEEAVRASARRRLRAKETIASLKSDLDWIVMKCLEKDRTRRYATANALALDVRRYLANEPVLACPPSAAYRLQKTWRRHRVAIVSAVALTALLLAATGISVGQAIRANRLARTEAGLRQYADEALAREADEHHRADEALGQMMVQRQQTEDALIKNEIQNSVAALTAGDSPAAVAVLARACRQYPTNEFVAAELFTTLTQHPFNLRQVEAVAFPSGARFSAFSPDGRRVVTALWNEARVWDAQTGQSLVGPILHGDGICSAVFSPDGKRLVTASEDHTARVWDAETGLSLTPPLKHGEGLCWAEFSPDGRRVATASNDGTARVWDAQTGQPVTPPLKHGAVVFGVQFSPEGRRVVTASGDGTARVWDAQTGQPLTAPLQHGGDVRSAAFSPEGRRVVTASADGTALVWDAQTGQPLIPPLKHDACVNFARFSPDGQRVVTGSDDFTARVWDAQTGRPVTPPLQHKNSVSGVTFSPDGGRVATGSFDHTARVWDAQTGQPLTEPLQQADKVLSIQFSPDGQRLLTAGWACHPQVWDVPTAPFEAALLELKAPSVLTARFSPEGRRVVTAAEGGTARVWDAQTGQPVTAALQSGGDVRFAEFSPDGERVVTAATDQARVWEVRTGQPVTAPINPGPGANCARFSPDGRRVLTASDDGTARVWDAQTGLPLTPPLKHGAEVKWVEFSPDGRRVATASWDHTARVWDAQTGQPLTGPLRHGGNVNCAHFSPEGRRVLTASDDGTARVWDAQTGLPLTGDLTHGGPVGWAEFSPEGRRVVTASTDFTARVWDAQTGQPLTAPLKHLGNVNCARFSSDGRRVVTVSSDGSARVWDAQTGLPLAEPLRQEDQAIFAEFSPDGRRVVVAVKDHTARVWVAPQIIPLPVPGWVPQLAEAMVNQRLDEEGNAHLVAFQELLELKRQVSASTGTDDWTRWAQWYDADPATRRTSSFYARVGLETRPPGPHGGNP